MANVLGRNPWGGGAPAVAHRVEAAPAPPRDRWRPRARPRGGVLIVGAGPAARAAAAALARRPTAGYALLGYVADGPSRGRADEDVIGPLASLPTLVARLRPKLVLVERLRPHAPLLVACVDRGVRVMTFAQLHERLESRVDLASVDAAWLVQALGDGVARPSDRLKRVLDVVLGALGLAATALLFPFIAAAIALGGGRGPLIYSQVRVGHRGRPFHIYKFRTMCADAERHGARWAAADDERVTPVGRLLRQTRLDELPQFWNVVRGDMSLVGPRPERPEFVRDLEREIPHYDRRHLVMPGVTGWAQVRYPYGASVEDARAKLQYDLFYLKHRSLAMDLAIMARTVLVMVRKVGAR